jgi:hypothetical protein
VIIAGEPRESFKEIGTQSGTYSMVYRYYYYVLTGWALKVTQSDSVEEQEASDDMIINSYVGCHLVLQGFISALLPPTQLSSGEALSTLDELPDRVGDTTNVF